MTNQTERSLIIKRVHEEARDIRAFDMSVDGTSDGPPVIFRPGQVALLRVHGEEPAYFAFASAPEDEELEFLIKRAVGASNVIYDMTEGDRVELVEIVGRGFSIEDHKGKDIVFVAMGTGVAPLRSALRHVFKHKNDYGKLVVLYGARTPSHFCYADETGAWESEGVELRQVISRPDGHDWSGPTGYVQSMLDHIMPTLKNPAVLVCGSREMIGQTRDRLHQMGFLPESVLTNY